MLLVFRVSMSDANCLLPGEIIARLPAYRKKKVLCRWSSSNLNYHTLDIIKKFQTPCLSN